MKINAHLFEHHLAFTKQNTQNKVWCPDPEETDKKQTHIKGVFFVSDQHFISQKEQEENHEKKGEVEKRRKQKRREPTLFFVKYD